MAEKAEVEERGSNFKCLPLVYFLYLYILCTYVYIYFFKEVECKLAAQVIGIAHRGLDAFSAIAAL